MKPSLSPEQMEEVLEASRRSDVPAGRLVLTAELIRNSLSTSRSGDRPPAFLTMARPTAPRVHTGGSRRRAPVRRAAALVPVFALIGLAVAAGAGALPAPLQNGIARGAAIVGIDVPNRDNGDIPAVTVPSDPERDPANGSRGSGGPNDVSPAAAPGTDPAVGASNVAPSRKSPESGSNEVVGSSGSGSGNGSGGANPNTSGGADNPDAGSHNHNAEGGNHNAEGGNHNAEGGGNSLVHDPDTASNRN
jgi:hypothetical protein